MERGALGFTGYLRLIKRGGNGGREAEIKD